MGEDTKMHNLSKFENYYKKFSNDLNSYLPEDIVHVDLELLHRLNLIHYHDPNYNDPSLTRYFHVVESDDKITLINDEFVVWIVPDRVDDIPCTYTFIALNETDKEPRIQMCFVASGVYNNSRLVLRVLEKFLAEIQESEEMLRHYQ